MITALMHFDVYWEGGKTPASGGQGVNKNHGWYGAQLTRQYQFILNVITLQVEDSQIVNVLSP